MLDGLVKKEWVEIKLIVHGKYTSLDTFCILNYFKNYDFLFSGTPFSK